jgi:hypothetical protein
MNHIAEDEPIVCMQAADGEGQCAGPVEYRMALSGTGISYPRCDKHWSERLEIQEGISARYPVLPPSDWSPLDAGEAWDEEDY